MKRRVLIIDDEPAIGEMLTTILEAQGYEVAVAYDGPSGLAELERHPPHVLLLDYMLPGMDGIVWPLAVAPYQVVISALNVNNPDVRKAAEQLYAELSQARIDVLLDDRDQRPGFKFKDADLIGVPLRVNVGEKGLAEGLLEIKRRAGGEVIKLPPAQVKQKIQELLSVELFPGK
jgi:threonyl-tRNA synthetase